MPRPRDPSLAQILQAVQDKSHRHINKALPGRVVSYDVATQTATVQPVVQTELGPDEYETMAELQDVPVIFPGGAAGFLHIPLAPGDNVLVVCCDEDLALWLQTGSISRPQVLQRHGLHPVAIPGLRHDGQAMAVTGGHATLAAAGELRLGDDGASQFVALANLVLERLQAIHTAVNAHVHVSAAPGSPTGPAVGAFSPPDPPPTGTVLPTTPADVAATKVRAV